jgi:hypothetical protein
MALGDLTSIQVKVLNLLRDIRPYRPRCWEVGNVKYPTVRQLARLGYIDLKGGPRMWTAEITDLGLRVLRAHHMKPMPSRPVE